MSKEINSRCPFQRECDNKKCEYIHHERECKYYYANATDDTYIEDQKAAAEKDIDWDNIEDTSFDDERYRQALQIHNSIMVHGAQAANSLMLMCQDLKRMRDEKFYKDLEYETFEDYCEEKVGIKSRQAYTYISTYEKLGKQMIEEYSSVGITKLAILADMNPVNRIDVLENEDVSEMSVRELKELRDKNSEYAEQIALFEDEKAQAKTEKESLEDLVRELRSQVKELEGRPTEISPKPSEDEINKLRKEIETEFAAEKQKDIDDAVKAEKERHKQDLQKMKDKAKKEADKCKQEEIAEAVSKAKAEAEKKAAEEVEVLKNTIETYKRDVAELEKAVKASDSATQKVNIYFNAFQDNLNKILSSISEIEDAEQKAKLKVAVERTMSEIIKKLKEV